MTVAHETESVLCRIALWGCLDPVSCAVTLSELIKEEITAPNSPIAQFDSVLTHDQSPTTYGKWQTSVKLGISQNRNKKLSETTNLCAEIMNRRRQGGTNSRMPFDVNVIINLSNNNLLNL